MNRNLRTVIDDHYEPDGRAKLRKIRRESYWIDVVVLVVVVLFLLMVRT